MPGRRNKDDPKNEFLTAMGAELPGDVTLYSADLVTAGAYDDACADADAVIHAAAQVDPFVVVDPIKDMVEPSTEGVKNILSSVNKWCATACLSLARHTARRRRETAGLSSIHIHASNANGTAPDAIRLALWRPPLPAPPA